MQIHFSFNSVSSSKVTKAGGDLSSFLYTHTQRFFSLLRSKYKCVHNLWIIPEYVVSSWRIWISSTIFWLHSEIKQEGPFFFSEQHHFIISYTILLSSWSLGNGFRLIIFRTVYILFLVMDILGYFTAIPKK